MEMMTQIYWPPYLLAVAGAGLGWTSALPSLVPGVGLRRWYQSLMMGAWALAIIAIWLAVAVASPWLWPAALLVLAIAGAAFIMRSRQSRGIEDEALAFMQSIVSIMTAGKNVAQAVRSAAQNADFVTVYPRMMLYAREVVALFDSGQPLSEALRSVAEASTARSVLEQIGIVARLAEENAEVTADIQRETLNSAWRYMIEVHNINRTMRQKMSQMELAKWIFTLIIPGINIFMAYQVPGYLENFMNTSLGLAILAFEGLMIIVIFIVFDRLQRLPEVRI